MSENNTAKPRFHTILVANRGEIARRILRTAKETGYGTVAVHSDADARAPHVREADRAVRLPGVRSQDTYLRGDLIIAAALKAGAQAIHPGYGFLSENADFARACREAGLVFIGPTPASIRAMADKLEAKRLVAAGGVPLAPGVELAGQELSEAEQDGLRAEVGRIGYPVLVKAAAGGGGRGMRLVRHESDLLPSVAGAQREARAAFGDGTVFVEKAIIGGRHVEVQVLADEHGRVVALADRDCSVQRRNQKIIEEAPAPALSAEVRTAMADAAIACARAADYHGVGTVEFLVDADGFYFLEMNTRLQVEHPVTEEVLGLDLVRLQLDVAQGRPLPDGLEGIRATGHSVEARLYAEDPTADYAPSPGVVELLDLPALPGVRYESAVETGTEVPSHYDPMIMKVIATGTDRTAAIGMLRRALSQIVLLGPVTNRSQLLGILDDPTFGAAEHSTALLTERSILTQESTAEDAAAAAIAVLAHEHLAAEVGGSLPAGPYRNVGRPRLQGRLESGGVTYRVGLTLRAPEGDGTRPATATVTHDDQAVTLEVRLVGVEGDTVDLEIDGIRRRLRVVSRGALLQVLGYGTAQEFRRLPLLGSRHAAGQAAGEATAPMPGAVVDVRVAPGDHVEEGQTLMLVEAMKMEHQIVAGVAGRVDDVLAVVGQQVGAGELLVHIVADGEG